MKGNFHVRFGERGGETRRPQGRKVRPAPTRRSGSFLLGAYHYLLDYHARYYAEQAGSKRAVREARQSYLVEPIQISRACRWSKKPPSFATIYMAWMWTHRRWKSRC